jgi:hypothetical protein
MRRLSWLLWLLIALMPARGIAQSLMVGGAFGHGTSAAISVAEAPCPMHAGAADSAPDDAAVTAGAVATATPDTSSAAHACSLCNVCHSAVLPLALPTVSADTLHQAAPLAALGLGAGRAAPSELFRPPR